LRELRILSPAGIIGYGFPEKSFEEGMRREPHFIGVDGGSADPGPYYLGSGKSFTSAISVKRDLTFILKAAREKNIPVVIGSAGGAGGRPHLDWMIDLVKEVALKKGLSFRVARIEAEINKDFLKTKALEGKVRCLPHLEGLTEHSPEALVKEIEKSCRIVAQMGVEPIIKALEAGAELVISGRTYDPAIFAAIPIREGFNRGLALHLGKIIECGALASTPSSGSDCIFGILRDDHFVVDTLNPDRRCTIETVSAHTLYERQDPCILRGPGGRVDLSETRFEQINPTSVKVSGSRFFSEKYTVLLEGARCIGFRTVCVAGIRDAIMISQISEIVEDVKKKVRDIWDENIQLNFRFYGKNGVMGEFEPLKNVVSHELGLVIEVIAKSQEIADAVCGFARAFLLHYGYPGRMATSGNLAFPYSPSDIKMGEVYKFNIYHLLDVEGDPCDLFPISLFEI